MARCGLFPTEKCHFGQFPECIDCGGNGPGETVIGIRVKEAGEKGDPYIAITPEVAKTIPVLSRQERSNG